MPSCFERRWSVAGRRFARCRDANCRRHAVCANRGHPTRTCTQRGRERDGSSRQRERSRLGARAIARWNARR